MNFKNIIIITLFLIPILAIGSVCAENINDNSTVIADDLDTTLVIDNDAELISDDIQEDDLKSCEDIENSDVLSISDKEDISSDNEDNLGISMMDYITFYDTVEIYDYGYSTSIFSISNIYSYAKGNITLQIDGKDVYNGVIQRYQKINTYHLSSAPSFGVHNVTISYDGTYYEPFTKNMLVNFTYYTYLRAYAYNQLDVYFSLPKNATGNITIRINNKSFGETNGSLYSYYFSLDEVVLGENEISVFYHGDSVYPPSEKKYTLIVNPYFNYPGYLIGDEEGFAKVTIPKNESGVLKLLKSITDDNGVSFYELITALDVVNGTAAIKLPKFNDSTIYYNLYFDGKQQTSEQFAVNYQNCSDKIQVIATTNITEGQSAKITVINNDTDLIEYLAMDIDGKLTLGSFSLSSKESNNTNYYANILIPNLSIGNHQIKLYTSYSSPVHYFKLLNITVNEKNKEVLIINDTSIPVENNNTNTSVRQNVSENNVKTSSNKVELYLKSAKIKKSVRKIVLQAILKVNKKLSKNTLVTFKFNGKSYKVKTNSKGLAKLVIKKSVIKKLKLNKKITYQVSYGGKTVKKTGVVKK